MDSKCALVVGSAPCVFDDMAAAPDWPLIVCNAMGLRIPGKIELWCSMHGYILFDRMKKRDKRGYDPDFQAYGHIHDHVHGPPDPRFHAVLRGNDEGIFIGGSSGMFAIQVALSLGYEKLVLCGIPLDGFQTMQDSEVENLHGIRGKYGGFDSPYIQYRKVFEEREDDLIGKVTSMSGWTRLHFGGPDV